MIRFDLPGGRFNHRAAGVVVHDGFVLLHRLEKDDFWSLPGGRVELMEPSHVTVVREFAEELGVEVRVDRMLWVVENFFEFEGVPYHETSFLYKVDLTDERHPLLDKERVHHGIEPDLNLLYKWFPVDRLERERFYPSFLRTEMQELPAAIQYVVHRDIEDNEDARP
ncbi:NUDIX hydrolase [Tumebacillus sp. ITR2]|uniref:NUDIX hydrolase n=1 Tax=Tumebacillus amylolyticus TaxID=2801339 RepID=A0ABS1JBS5_9BACL|nr:NUDIX hydrolase [Tumebacillus amylolyticus]MBL0387726.1 NUDIX hydrolase [Tumebacillus amylolyticus]